MAENFSVSEFCFSVECDSIVHLNVRIQVNFQPTIHIKHAEEETPWRRKILAHCVSA